MFVLLNFFTEILQGKTQINLTCILLLFALPLSSFSPQYAKPMSGEWNVDKSQFLQVETFSMHSLLIQLVNEIIKTVTECGEMERVQKKSPLMSFWPLFEVLLSFWVWISQFVYLFVYFPTVKLKDLHRSLWVSFQFLFIYLTYISW